MKKKFRISRRFMPLMTIRIPWGMTRVNRHETQPRGHSICIAYAGLFAALLFFSALILFAGCTGRGVINMPSPAKLAGDVSKKIIEKPAGAYYDYMMAEISLKNGDPENAVRHLEEAVQKDPDSLLIKKELAVLYVQQKRKKDALFLADDILAKTPDDVEALIISGSIRQSMGDLPAAEKAYEKVLSIDPGRKNIYVVLGRLYLLKGDFEAAADLFNRMVQKFGDSYPGYYYLGKAYAGKKAMKKSEAAFLKALEIGPTLMEPRVALIGIYRETKDVKAEIGQYEALLRAYPKNAVAAVDLGLLYVKTGKRRKAAALFKDLGTKSIDDLQVTVVVLKNLIAQKRYDDALTVLEGMEAGAPGSSDISYLIGVTFYMRKNFDKALPRLLSVSDDSRFYVDSVLHAATIYDSSEKPNAAITLLDSAFQTATDEDKVRIAGFLAAFCEKTEDYEMAVNVLGKAIDISPDNADLHYSLGIVLDKKGDADAAVKEMKTVIRLSPEHADALNYLGYTYADKGINLAEAEAFVKKALSLKPDNGYILDSMGWVYFKKGDFKNALVFLSRAVEAIPDDPILIEHLGDVYRVLNQVQKALETYERALSEEKGDQGEKDSNRESLEKKIDALKKEGV